MSSAPAPRLKRVVVAVVVVALTIGVGTLIGTELGHRRAADRVREQAARSQAADAAEARREREEFQQEREREAPEKTVDDANDALLAASKAGRRDAVARQEETLDRLARQQAATEQDAAPAKHPFGRELDRFPIKRRPLFAQQISSGAGSHVLFVSVFKAHFCLKSAAEREQAVRATYQPIARRLREQNVDDLELLVVPVSSSGPRRSEALARAEGQTDSLTSRGRSC